MRIVVKFDGREYEADSARGIIQRLRAQSFDGPKVRTIRQYKEAVSERARQMYGMPIRTGNDLNFLRDLERIGAIKSLVKIISP